MSTRLRQIAVGVIAALALVTVVVVGVFAWQRGVADQTASSAVATSPDRAWDEGDRIVFRNTAMGEGYGHLASVPLSRPSAPRALADIACDRVDAVAEALVCLRTERGVVPDYTATLYAADGMERARWSLSGIPSRTRLSDDGKILATTAFVTGHSYAALGFSTETVLRTGDGDPFANLEEFALTIDGVTDAPVDRNFWGVTFVDDSAFYATARTGGRTYLVRGDLDARTLESVAADVECPSVSPDGTRVAFKLVTSGSGPTVHWTPAILDLATKEVTELPESRSVDDQIEWLDDETIMYGIPRTAGDTDVWALSADGSADPITLIEHAWSPSVVRDR